MRYSGVGGQAVMEGVMMKNQDRYAIAVRKPDGEIEVKVKKYRGPAEKSFWRKVPIVRGVVSFIDSLYLGMGTLMDSAALAEDEEEKKKIEEKKKNLSPEERKKFEQKEARKENAMMGTTLVISLIMAMALFFALPYFLSAFFQRFISSAMLIALLEGVIRMVIFIGYILVISRMQDIRRVFMYHGAEHKCINCIEHGMELNVENVKKSSRLHKRCGTSFLLIVMIISILFFMFIQVDSKLLRLVLRLALIPVIAGVSYEFIRLAGRYDNAFVNALSQPGLWMQRLTTSEPDEKMIEVGMASVNAVFDWEKWQKEDGACRCEGGCTEVCQKQDNAVQATAEE